jgi:hypothetical protein
MELLRLDTWPTSARLLLELAQERADAHSHAHVSGAHIASALLDMEPVRRLVGDAAAVTPLDAAVERALLVTQKGRGMAAMFTGSLGRLVGGSRALTTLELLRGAMAGTPGLGKVEPVLAARAEAIAALFDAPVLCEILRAPTAPATSKLAPHLTLGVAEMLKRNHRDVTTRHVLAAWVRSCEGVLRKRGEPGLGDVGPRLDAILDREPRRPGDAIQYAPRLVGALAAAIATAASQPEVPLSLGLLLECLAGDEALRLN